MSHGMKHPSSPARIRLDGLDALRGLCALAVVLGHVELPELGMGALGKLLRLGFHVVSNGPAAVVVFFVVSGLCIHLPQAGGRGLHIPTFYLRRAVRIGLPMAAGFALAWSTGALSEFRGILWSLIAEVIYYLIYPALLWAAKRFGWKWVLGASAVGALALLGSDPKAVEYPHFGWSLTWVLGLPIWILGCMLAESLHKPRQTGAARTWLMRGAILAASAVAVVARWQLGSHSIGFPWTLSVFGVVAWLWLEQELVYFRSHPPAKWLDTIGAASYSLYLSHVAVLHLCWVLWGETRLTSLGFRLAMMVLAVLGGGIFYLAVELPSHRLAKALDLKKHR